MPDKPRDLRSSQSGTLELHRVTKSFGKVTAASDIELKVAEGEFVSLLGPSGSGKTTTLNMIAGFEYPDSGRVVIGGKDVTGISPHKRNLGMVLQGYALFPHMSVRENVGFPLRVRGIKGAEARRAIDSALEIVSLTDYGDRRPRELSGGQQQRVALARSFVHRPPVLLMDEPLSALDRALRAQMQSELRRIHREVGTTVIYVTHDQDEAMSLSDHVVVMQNSRVVQIGAPRDIYHSPATTFVAGFVGSATMVPVTWTGGAQFTTHDGSVIKGVPTQPLEAPGSGVAVLRPEDARIGAATVPSANTFKVLVNEKVFVGDKVVCIGSLASGGDLCEFWVTHDEEVQITPGQPVLVNWRMERTAIVPAD